MKKVAGVLAACAAVVILMCCGGTFLVSFAVPRPKRIAPPAAQEDITSPSHDGRASPQAGETGGSEGVMHNAVAAPEEVPEESPEKIGASRDDRAQIGPEKRVFLAEEAQKLYRRTRDLRKRMDEAKRTLNPRTQDKDKGRAWGEFARSFRTDYEVLA